MAAGAITVVLRIAQFPNGRRASSATRPPAARRRACPDRRSPPGTPRTTATASPWPRSCSCWRWWHVRGKPGRAWAALRQSQATAVAAGVNVTLYRLWAFALASFMAGVAGALLAAAAGGVNINQFPVQNSILLLAVVLMGGVYSLGGAVVAALLLRLSACAAGQLGGLDRAAHDPVRRRRPPGAPDRARRASSTRCRRISPTSAAGCASWRRPGGPAKRQPQP
jgi:branched-chain amino acid transport system permease protein